MKKRTMHANPNSRKLKEIRCSLATISLLVWTLSIPCFFFLSYLLLVNGIVGDSIYELARCSLSGMTDSMKHDSELLYVEQRILFQAMISTSPLYLISIFFVVLWPNPKTFFRSILFMDL